MKSYISMYMNLDKSPAEIIKIVGTSGDPIGKQWSYYDFTNRRFYGGQCNFNIISETNRSPC